VLFYQAMNDSYIGSTVAGGNVTARGRQSVFVLSRRL